jgi:peroxiredoxin
VDSGTALVAIAIQKIDGILKARRFVEERQLPFPILFDQTREVTRAYGVYHHIGLDAYRIARPSAFVLDTQQTVRWIAVSPHQRPHVPTADIIAAGLRARAAEV